MSKKITYENSLKAMKPDLMKEWDELTNSSLGLFPDALSPYTHKKASWKCSRCGHVWIAEINSRSRGTGCPNCKGEKISKAKESVKPGNSLAERFPEIVKEWHPNRNGNIAPETINSGSKRVVWWQCEKGHEWEAAVCNRTNSKNHTACPECSKELHTSFPEQAILFYLSNYFPCENRAIIDKKEIDVFIPSMKIGVEYDGRYYHPEATRIRENDKDRYFESIGLRIIRVKESTRNTVTDNCIEYIYSSSNYDNLSWAIVELLKKFGIADPMNVNVQSNRLNILSQYIQLAKQKSLCELYPALADEWDVKGNNGLLPVQFTAGSHKKVLWKCSEGHSYPAAINERVRYYIQGKTFGCPYCSGHKVLRGFNDLQTLFPAIAQEWDLTLNGDITPSDVTAGSSAKKFNWKCSKCGNVWSATVSNRTHGRGCPTCKSQTIREKLVERAAKTYSFADAFPELVSEWDSSNILQPTDVAPHSNKKVKWICSKCGHRWETSVNNRASGYGCKECYIKNRPIVNNRKVICVETQETFESIAEASRKMSVLRSAISNCLSGRVKSAGGYHWKYIED